MNRMPRVDAYSTGQNIKRLMTKHGMTVKKLQEHLGLQTPQSIYHWFSGRSMPTIDNLYCLSTLFFIPVDKLICGNRKEIVGFDYGSSEYRGLVYWKAIYNITEPVLVCVTS